MDNANGPVEAKRPSGLMRGMSSFTFIWAGQVFSLLGTSMTSFALTIWAWQVTGQATVLGLVSFFNFVPLLLMTPIAGAMVDRSSRKRVIIFSDLLAGLPTVAMFLLYSTGSLQIWHLYLAGAFSGTFQAFHFPAYSAAISMIVPKEQYGRASGMLSTAEYASGIFAPVAAALLMSTAGIASVMAVDIITFITAISSVSLIQIPQPAAGERGHKGVGNIWTESFYGFRYICGCPSLLGLQLVLFSSNLVSGLGFTIFTPAVLARTGGDNIVLGTVMSIGGIGGLVGSILLVIWGGPKRKVHGVLMGDVLSNLLGWVLVGLGGNQYVWSLAAFLGLFFMPILNGANQAIWQVKVAPDLQGRVFASRRFIAQVSSPLGMLIAGPLADRFFEPNMMPGGDLTAIFGWMVGTGPGTGMSLMLIISGFLGAAVALGAYCFGAIRDVEDILPDYGAKPAHTVDG
jgi:DHA3 family macrolide efflux protein-like MFS transporter